jgi:hypothetical protein
MPWDELLTFWRSVRDFTRRPIAGTRRQRLGVPRRRGTRPRHRQTPPNLEAGLQEQARSRDGAQFGTQRAGGRLDALLDDDGWQLPRRLPPRSEASDQADDVARLRDAVERIKRHLGKAKLKRCHLCRSRSSIRCCSSRCEQAGRFGRRPGSTTNGVSTADHGSNGSGL